MNFYKCSGKQKEKKVWLVGKRGSLEDIAFLTIFLVVLAIFVYPITDALIAVNNEIQNITDLCDDCKAISQDVVTRYPRIMEGIYAMLLIIGYVGTFMLASRIDTHMPMFIIAMIFFTAMILVIPMLANVWDGITNGNFSRATDQFVIIPFVMQHYLKIGLAAWFLVGFSIYAKRLSR